MPLRKDLTAQKFHHLTVLKDSGHRDKHKQILWECQCVCGKTSLVRGMDLKYGRIQSCGCKRHIAQSREGKKHVDAILETMTEGTNIAVLNSKPTKRNKSGVKGVFWNNSLQQWTAILHFQGKRHYLGSFDDIHDAARARSLAEEKYFDPLLKKYGRPTTDPND